MAGHALADEAQRSWKRLASDVPEIAAAAEAEFRRTSMALVGTVRVDGSPRISAVNPCIIDDSIYLGMMWRSRKARDLQRDNRIVLHNAICTNSGNEVEISLRGRAIEVFDPAVVTWFVAAVAATTEWRDKFHLFQVEVVEAAMVSYGNGLQTVRLWPSGKSRTRTYG